MQDLTTTSLHRFRGPTTRRTFVASLGAVALALPLAQGLSRPASAQSQTALAIGDFDRQITSISPERHRVAVTQLVNQERTKRGLKPLLPSAQLERSARSWANIMSRNDGDIHHGDFAKRARRFPFVMAAKPDAPRYVGENIGFGSSSYSTPRAIVETWMNSSGHRANILRKWRYGAVWSSRSGDTVTVVHHLGRTNRR